MHARQIKGNDIGRRLHIEQVGEGSSQWLVPSQSGRSPYTVDLANETPRCTCPDYELSGVKCKHIYAVEYLLAADEARETNAPPPCPPQKPKRPTYRQDWPAYNAAQVNEKDHFQSLLHALCRDVADLPLPPGAGRHRLPLRDMLFAACFKVYSTVSCRRFMADLTDAQAKGYLSRLPCYNSIFNYFEMAELTPVLKALIEQSAQPLRAIETSFTVDSSGFTTCRYVRWYDAKYGQEMEEHEWIKAHIMCGVLTNIVTSVEITDGHGADYTQFRPLVKATAQRFNMYEVSADKAYSGRGNLQLVEDRHATPYIPFRSNATARAMHDSKADVWDRLYHYFHLHRETFLEHYHRRSIVESTFWMVKAKFGEALRSKTDVAQVNELLCKVLCHNLCCLIQSMYELGIEPEF